jgi:hypothetical protein
MRIKPKILIAFLFILIVMIPAAVVIGINNGQTNDAIARQYQIDQNAKGYEEGARDLHVGIDLYLRGKKELGRQLIDRGTTLMATSRNSSNSM